MSKDVNAPAWQPRAAHEPTDFAGVTTLGKLVQAYPPREDPLKEYRPLRNLGLVLVVTGVLIMLGLVIGGIPMPEAAFGATMSPIGLFIYVVYARTLRRFRSSVRSVATFEHGFATRIGPTLGVWRWDDVTSILSDERYRSSNSGGWTTRSYTFTIRSGVQLLVTDDWFENVKVVALALKTRVFDVLRPPLNAEYAAGAAVTFGVVTVSKGTIESGGRRIAWNDVRDVVVKIGCLVVTPLSGPPLTVQVTRIPNVEVLGSLIGVDPSTMDLQHI